MSALGVLVCAVTRRHRRKFDTWPQRMTCIRCGARPRTGRHR